jgi:hypothetical protein
MSDSVKAWHEMQEEKLVSLQADEAIARELKRVKYIWLLDFVDGKVYRYDISVLCNEENKWNPDHESCEAFLYGAGHSLKDCEWMVTKTSEITIK